MAFTPARGVHTRYFYLDDHGFPSTDAAKAAADKWAQVEALAIEARVAPQQRVTDWELAVSRVEQDGRPALEAKLTITYSPPAE